MRAVLDKVDDREWIVVENHEQKIFGILHRPLACENPPLVIILHGFASSKHGSNRCYVTLAERLAKEGIATLRFDFRGSGDSEGSLSEISLNDLVSDALAVLHQVEEIEGIDSSRIALFGASLGGALAILAAAQFQKIKTLCLWASVASGEIWYREFIKRNPQYAHSEPSKVFSSYRGISLHPLFRDQFQQMAAWKTVQQLNDIPILLMQGEKDEVVTIAHLEAYRESTLSKKEVKCIRYPDGEHILGFSPYFPHVIQESVEWYKKYL